VDFGLTGKTALVLDSGSAVGKTCARLLAAEGAGVITRGWAKGNVAPADILIAVLPTAPPGFLEDTTDAALTEAWDAIETLAATAQALIPHMRAKSWGRIVCVGPAEAKNMTGLAVDIDRIVGLGALGLQKDLAGEMGKFGITAATVLLDRTLEPADEAGEAAAATAVYLASEGASYLTGIVLTMDGDRGRSVF
jgi:NAD(P)-dependent dehydrogenase (short-subunit alcohol dehydrogenase family)